MEEKQQEEHETKEERIIPVSAILECVTGDLGSAIFAIKNNYNLSAGLLDLALTPIVCKVKEMKNAELSQTLNEWRNENGD